VPPVMVNRIRPSAFRDTGSRASSIGRTVRPGGEVLEYHMPLARNGGAGGTPPRGKASPITIARLRYLINALARSCPAVTLSLIKTFILPPMRIGKNCHQHNVCGNA